MPRFVVYEFPEESLRELRDTLSRPVDDTASVHVILPDREVVRTDFIKTKQVLKAESPTRAGGGEERLDEDDGGGVGDARGGMDTIRPEDSSGKSETDRAARKGLEESDSSDDDTANDKANEYHQESNQNDKEKSDQSQHEKEPESGQSHHDKEHESDKSFDPESHPDIQKLSGPLPIPIQGEAVTVHVTKLTSPIDMFIRYAALEDFEHEMQEKLNDVSWIFTVSLSRV